MLRVAALLILLAPAVECDADEVKVPVERIDIQDMIDAFKAMFWRPDPEVKRIVIIELVTVQVDGKTKLVYRPVSDEAAIESIRKD